MTTPNLIALKKRVLPQLLHVTGTKGIIAHFPPITKFPSLNSRSSKIVSLTAHDDCPHITHGLDDFLQSFN